MASGSRQVFPVSRFPRVKISNDRGSPVQFRLAFWMVLLLNQTVHAWSAGGHHLITVMAYGLLTAEEQGELQRILLDHPRFSEDFSHPKNVIGQGEIDLWRIGRAGHWSDIARSQTLFHRPNWHWQQGSSLTIGHVEVPLTPGSASDGATLNSKPLHIAQAIELCRGVLKDKSRQNSDRALAVGWLAHLIADAHQPCHAGSLYVEGLFPEGDRGGNSIPTRQSKNLHALWDSLLGPKFDARDIQRRAQEIQLGPNWKQARDDTTADIDLLPIPWLVESSAYARSHVYSEEVLGAVEAAVRGSQKIETVDLSKEYLKAAGSLAKTRAAFAAHRLAGVLHQSLESNR